MTTHLTTVLIVLTLVALSLGNAPPAEAQVPEAFDPGYVVTTDGDTLRGQIGRLLDLDATRRIVFIPADGTEPVEFNVGHALGYGLDTGRRYVRRTFRPGRDTQPTPLFLQVLVDGDLTLYTYALSLETPPLGAVLRDADPYERFAVEDRYGNVRGLYQLRGIVERPGSQAVQSDRQYARVLTGLYAACPKEQERAPGLRYSRRQLVASVIRYNECVGAEVWVPERGVAKRRPDARLGFALRGGMGQLRYNSDRGSAGGRLTYYVAGALEYRIHRLPGRSALLAEASLHRKGGGEPERLQPYRPDTYEKHVLGLSLGWRHAFGRDTAPYLASGALLGLWINADGPYTDRVGVIEHIRHHPYTTELGFFAEGGLDLPYGRRILSVGLRVEQTSLRHQLAPGRRTPRNEQPGFQEAWHSARTMWLLAGMRF